MISFFVLLFIFLVVIGLHEGGHALAAKFFKVTIQRVSLGFGKPLLMHRSKSGIEWVWALWPIGGYVQLLNSRIHPVDAAQKPFCFDSKPPGIRCMILLAGVFANLLVAWLALTLVFVWGFKQYLPVIDKLKPDGLLAKAGVQPGDQIMAIGDANIASWQEAGMQLILVFGEKNVKITLKNPQNQTRNAQVNLNNWHFPAKKGALFSLLGIETGSLKAHEQWVFGKSLPESSLLAFHKCWELLFFFALLLKQILTAQIPFSILLGPLGFIHLSLASFSQGFSVFMYFIASLSLSVAFINLLPIPGLDGASVLYTAIEKIRGKAMSVALEILLYRLAIIVLVLVFIQLILNDIKHDVGGQF